MLLNKIKTVLLLAGLTGVLLLVGSIWGTAGLTIAIVLALLINVGSFWFSDKIVLKMYKAQPASKKEYPELYKIIAKLAKKAKLPMPKVYILPQAAPNAFATGRSPSHSAVAVTIGLLELLTSKEIEAVLAHEFMHYVELVRKFTTLDILSDETVGTLHETIYSDYERLYEPKWLFQDRGLIRLLNSRFLDGLVDDRLNKNTLKKWVQKDLPSKILPPDANVVRIPIASILRTNFDPLLKNRLEELEKIRAVANE